MIGSGYRCAVVASRNDFHNEGLTRDWTVCSWCWTACLGSTWGHGSASVAGAELEEAALPVLMHRLLLHRY